MAPGGTIARPCLCGMTCCNCIPPQPVYIIADSSSIYREPSRHIGELEEEIISLRRELASTKAELFRLRNQRRSR